MPPNWYCFTEVDEAEHSEDDHTAQMYDKRYLQKILDSTDIPGLIQNILDIIYNSSTYNSTKTRQKLDMPPQLRIMVAESIIDR
jgi:hypothetical protein